MTLGRKTYSSYDHEMARQDLHAEPLGNTQSASDDESRATQFK